VNRQAGPVAKWLPIAISDIRIDTIAKLNLLLFQVGKTSPHIDVSGETTGIACR
jgi:hypothetical protein